FLVRRRENGEMPRLEIELEGAAVGDFLAALDRLLLTGKQPVHLGRGADVELIAAIAHAIVVLERPAGVDAQQNVVRHTVFLTEVVGVAGLHERQAKALGNVNGALGAALLNIQAIVLYFDVEVLAKGLGEPAGQLGGFVELVLENEFAEFAGGTAG